MRRNRQVWFALATVAAIAVAVRATLPWGVESYVNAKLAAMGDYSGRVEDVDLALLRGAYVLHGVTVEKVGARTAEPFLVSERMDISLQWDALLRARVVGELVIERPVLNMIQGETEEETQLGAGVNWPAEIRELAPFTFNRVAANDGLVTFRAPGIEADESLTLRDARLLLHNLTNVQDEDQVAFAELALAGYVMGSAPLRLEGRFDPNAELPTFDIDLTLEDARLVEVNPWLDEFLNVDAEQGSFSMYTEIAAAEGRFEGYLKPIMRDPRIFDADRETEGPFRKAWEALVELASNLFENREADQVATQIPFAGELDEPRTGLLAAMVNLLRNAFVAAFSHSLEGTISLRDVVLDAGADVEAKREEADRDESTN